jgi:hypothetical protein
MFQDACIWDPTQAIKGANWDRAVSLGKGRIFILEDKGTTAVKRTSKKPLETHRIEIRQHQLDEYCNKIDIAGGTPVYYVLPQPPWTGPVSCQPVPDQAICRITSATGPFERWAYVSRCTDLRAKLAGRRSIDTDQLPLAGGWTLADFLKRVQQGEIGRRTGEHEDVSEHKEADAFAAKSSGQRERLSTDPETRHTGSLSRVQHVGSALAVFVPAENLTKQAT